MSALRVSSEDQERRNELDRLLAQASTTMKAGTTEYTLPEMLGDYIQVVGKPGWYVLPMCIEVELRITEFVAQVREDDKSVAALMRTTIDLASCLLYRVNLPPDADAAMDVIRAAIRGQGEILRLATPQEIGRAFRSSQELIDLVLKPQGVWQDEEPADPNA